MLGLATPYRHALKQLRQGGEPRGIVYIRGEVGVGLKWGREKEMRVEKMGRENSEQKQRGRRQQAESARMSVQVEKSQREKDSACLNEQTTTLQQTSGVFPSEEEET